MKKKIFLLVPVMMLALAACDNGNNPSAPKAKEYISVTALKSLFNSYTVEGTYVYAQRSGFETTGTQISLKTRYQTDGIELSITLNGNSVERQFVNSNGYVAQWYHDVDNKVKLQYVAASSGTNAVSWSFNNDFDSIVSVKDFVKQEDGTYSVVNADTRTAFATAMAMGAVQIGAYDPNSLSIAKMNVKVEEDKITEVSFESEEYISSMVRYKDTATFTITHHDDTKVKCELEAYDTYPEANALKEAFDKVGHKTHAKITTNNTYRAGTTQKRQTVETNVYMNENLYYFERTNNNETSRQGLTHSDVVGGTVIFTSDASGNLTVTNTYDNVKLSDTIYYSRLDQISPEMFEYVDGKYVTRNADDAYHVGSYLLQDGAEEYISELSIELDENKNIKVSYEYTAQVTNQTIVISKNEMTFGEYKDSDVAFLKLDAMEDKLSIAKDIPANMVNTWAKGKNSVTVSKYVVNVNGSILDIKEIKDGVIKGTYVNSESKTINVKLSLIAATEKSDAMLSLTFDEEEPIKLLGKLKENVTFTSSTFPLGYIQQFLTNNPELEIPTINATSYEYMIVSQEGYNSYFAVAVNGLEAGVQFVNDLQAAGWTVSGSSDGSSYNCVDPSNKTTVVVAFNSDSNGNYTLIAFFDVVA